MAVTQLLVYFGGFASSGEARPLTCMFADAQAAAEAFSKLTKAAAGYHARANDRERMVAFTTLGGECSVDISCVASIGYEEALREDVRAALEEWECGFSEIKAKASLAAKSVLAA